MNNPQMAEALKKIQSDPKMMAQLKAYQEAMQRPEMQQQMQQMQAVMGNPQLQARLSQLKGDPEFADFFKDIAAGGMQAMMKYYNDPDFLAKLGSKLGDVNMGAVTAAPGAPPAGAAPAAAGPPEIKDLLDAARWGDDEAVEDFIAIGKDVAMKDKEGRTPLHYAAGYNHDEVAKMLIEAGAPIEARDTLENTPLHYAAGYGRPDLVTLLLAAGADKGAKNRNGKTPYDLATADARNPVSQVPEVVAALKL